MTIYVTIDVAHLHLRYGSGTNQYETSSPNWR